MKKIATVFMAILLAAAMLLPQAMLADQGAVFTMNGTDNVPAGGTFDVTLSVSGEYAIHAAHLSVEYDPNSLELVGLEELDVMKSLRSGNNLVILDYETLAYQGKIKLGIGMPTDAMNAKGDIFKMTFKVKDGVSVNQQIVMIVNEFVNAPVGGESTPQAFTTHNAIITISGAKDPEGGFNRGEEAVGDNKTSAPNYQPTETKQAAPRTTTPPAAMNGQTLTGVFSPPLFEGVLVLSLGFVSGALVLSAPGSGVVLPVGSPLSAGCFVSVG